MPIEAWNREAIYRLIYESERVISPVTLKTGAYYYPQGAYQVFEAPDGSRVGIWAQDPDDLVLEDLIVDEKLSGKLFKYDESNNRIPVAIGDRLPGRIKDLGNGNLNRLRIFTVKTAYQAEKWLQDEMSKHQAAYRAFVLEQGMLVREAENRWTSGGIVYNWLAGFQPQGIFSNFVHNNGIAPRVGDGAYCEDDGTPWSDLLMTVAPTYGWRLGHDYDRLYSRDLGGAFMRAVSLRAKRITLHQAGNLVISDFEKRAQLFIEGLDSYTMRDIAPATFKKERAGKIARAMNKNQALKKLRQIWRTRPIRKGLLYALYGGRQVDWKDVGVFAVVTGASVLVLGGVMHYFGSSFNPAVLAGRISGRTLNKAGQRINEYTRGREMSLSEPGVQDLYSYYAKNWNSRQIWGSKPDPAKLHLLRALNHSELNTDLNFCSQILEKLPDDLTVMEYIFGVLQGPPGSRITPFHYGRYGGVRVDEPNGLSVEHIPDRDACFARLDWTKLDRNCLPDSVVRVFENLPANQPYLKISYNPQQGGLRMMGMTAIEYGENVGRITKSEFPPKHRLPDPKDVRLVPPDVPQIKKHWLDMFGKDTSDNASDATEESVEKLSHVVKAFRPHF